MLANLSQMLPPDTLSALGTEKLDAERARVLREAGVALAWPPGQFAVVFAQWMAPALEKRGWDTDQRAVLTIAAAEQISWTAALRIISTSAFEKTERALLSNVDVNLMGSIGRGEACRFSDHDLLAIARDDLEMVGLAGRPSVIAGDPLLGSPARPVTSTTEQARSDAFRSTSWLRQFLHEMHTSHGYQLPARRAGVKEPDAYVVTVGDFDDKRTLQHNDGYHRHAGNLVNSRFPMREHADRTRAVIARIAKSATAGDLARHRLDAMENARNDLTDPYRPHEAHKLLTQTWQALLFYLDGASPRKLPYWFAPLDLTFDDEARHEWRIGIESMTSARRTGSLATGAHHVIGAALALVRSAPSRNSLTTRGITEKVRAAIERRLK